jgi:hypothetical protein
MKVLISFLTAILFSMIIGPIAAGAVGVSPEAGVMTMLGISVVQSFIPMPKGFAFMAVTKEIWLNDIVSNLFKANPHLGYAINADSFVLAGKVVHIPNAGSKPGVQKNRSKVPATVLKRNDIDITFPLDEYTSDPILIDNAENYELSYDKRASVMSEQNSAIAELVGDWFFRYWAPSAGTSIIRTSGASASSYLGTGNRKAVTLNDVKAAQKLFNKLNIPAEGRVAELDAELMDQLTSELTSTQYRDFSASYDQANGVLGKLYGFSFLAPRSSILTYTNAATPVVKDPGEAEAASDNGAGLFWHRDMVIRAMGNNEFFETLSDPTYYGDIYSALLRAGGRIKRNDQKGVVALVQAAA